MRFNTAWGASALVILSGALAGGCGNACDDAVAHAEACGLSDEGDEVDVDCTDIAECAATCFVKAPCGAFDGSDPGATKAYNECVAGC